MKCRRTESDRIIKSHSVSMAKLKEKTGQPASVVDFFNWNQFSSLQKLATIVPGVIALSWFLSLWTLLILYLLCVAGAWKLSNKMSDHETGPLLAETFILKVEEAYVWVCHRLSYPKTCFSTSDFKTADSTPLHQQTEDLNPFSVSGSEKQSDSTSFSNVISVPVGSELNSLQLLIIRDFVESWYSTFSYNKQFLRESKSKIQESCDNVAVSLSHQNPQVLVTLLLKIVRVHVTMYMKAKSVFDTHQIHPKTKVPKDSIKRYASVEESFEKQYGFHEALTTDETEVNYLRGIISMILLSAFPKATTEGICTRTLLVEIITNKVVLPLLHMMSDPDWLMEKIILLTSEDNVFDNGENNEQSTTELEDSMKCSSQEISICHENKTPSEETAGIIEKLLCEEDDRKTTEDVKEKEELYHHQTPEVVQNQNTEGQEPPEDVDIDTTLCAQSSVESLQDMVCCECKNDSASEKKSSVQSIHGNSWQEEHDESNKTLTPNCERVSLSKSDPCDKDIFSAEPEISRNSVLENGMNKENDVYKHILDSDKLSSDMENSLQDSLSSDQDRSLVDSSDQSEIFEVNPQKIISYKSVSLSESTPNSLSVTPEPTSSSFPKFSSFKNFLVDSFKSSNKNSNVEKPKTLELSFNNLTSALNPLSKSKLSKLNEDQRSSNSHYSPPLVLVDGKPAENLSDDRDSLRLSHPSLSDNGTPSPKIDPGVSPEFFRSIHPYLSKSSSHSDLSVSNLEVLEESPDITPSPTDIAIFDGVVGDQKHNQNGRKAFDSDHDVMAKSMSGDQRIFQDISIPHAMRCQEYGRSSQYSLYVIEYDALYFNEEGKSVLKSGVVKRRHREFANLQSRLESHPSFKKHLKNIRGPRRWPILRFKSLEQETVESRRQLLQKYLQDLISVEAICNGPDIREFLAYEGDSHIAFVKKSDISVPRFDKMLMRGVSGVVDKLKSIPNIPSEVMSGLINKEPAEYKISRPFSLVDEDAMEVKTTHDRQEIDSSGSILNLVCQQLAFDYDNSMDDDNDDLFDVSYAIKDLKGDERTQETYRQEVDKLLSSLPNSSKDGERNETEEETQSQTPNISPVLFELLVQGLQRRNHWICQEQAVKLLQAFCGKALNSSIETSIKELTSDPQLVIYLRLLRETIWPQGKLKSDSEPSKTDEEKAATREKAKKCLVKFFPWILPKFVGEDDFDAMLEVYISCLHYPKLNRHLLYHLLDFLVEQLFPEATSCENLQMLLFSNTSLDSAL